MPLQTRYWRYVLYSTGKEMRFRKISSQKFDPTGEFFHDSAIQMQEFIAFAAQKFGINQNTFYLCNVRINVLTIQVCFLRGQAVNVTTQFVKPYIKCKTIHHHFQESLFEEKFTPYSWNQELTRVISWLELNRWFHSSEDFGGITWQEGLMSIMNCLIMSLS